MTLNDKKKSVHCLLYTLQGFEGVTVDYVTLPGWKAPITAARTFSDLPEKAQSYVLKIEELLGVYGTCQTLLRMFFFFLIWPWTCCAQECSKDHFCSIAGFVFPKLFPCYVYEPQRGLRK